MKRNFARNVQHLCHGASGDGPITIRQIWTNRNHGPVTTQTHRKIDAATALKHRMHSCKKIPTCALWTNLLCHQCRKIIPGIPFTIHQPPMPTCRGYSKPLLTYLPVPKMLTLQLVNMIVFGTFMQT